MYTSNFVANCDFFLRHLLQQHVLKDEPDSFQIIDDLVENVADAEEVICEFPRISSHVRNIGKFPMEIMLPMISNVRLSRRPNSVNRSEYFQTKTKEEYINHDATNYMIIAKPGIETNKLAAKLEEHFKCVHIDGDRLIEREIQSKSQLGIWLHKNLQLNKNLPIEIILWLIQREIRTSKVVYRGYILTGLPIIPNTDLNIKTNFLTEEDFLAFQQIVDELIDVPITNRLHELAKLKAKLFSEYENFEDNIDEEDLTEQKNSWEGFRPPPKLFHRLSCDDDVRNSVKRQLYFVLDLDHKPTILIYIDCDDEDIITKNRNKTRKLDKLEGIRVGLKRYNYALDVIQQFVCHFPQSNIIYCQGIFTTEETFKNCIIKIHNTCCYRKVFNTIDFYDMFKDDETIIAKLEAATTPRDKADILYKINPVRKDLGWFKSSFENKCPVMTIRGKCVLGKYQYSVQFNGKIYWLSSDENKRVFLENPQLFMPCCPTCRVCIMGPSTSGKTTFAQCLAQFFENCIIIDVNYVFEYYRNVDVRKLYYTKALEQAISTLQSQSLDDHNKKTQIRADKIDEWITIIRSYIIDFLKPIPRIKDKQGKLKPDKKAANENKRLRILLSESGFETDNPVLLKRYLTSNGLLLNKLPLELRTTLLYREPEATDTDVSALVAELMKEWGKDYVLPMQRKLEILVTKVRLCEKRQKMLTKQQKLYGYWILDGLPPDIELFQGLQETDCFPDIIINMDDSVGDRLAENQNIKCRREFYDTKYVVDTIVRTNKAFFKAKINKIKKQTVKSPKHFEAQLVRRELDHIILMTSTEAIEGTNDYFLEENNKYRENFERLNSFLEPFDTHLIHVDIHNLSWTDTIICGIRDYMNYFKWHSYVLKEDWLKDETLPSDGILRLGNTAEYCPVLFLDKMLLKLGRSQYAVQLKNRTYMFSSEVALQTFLKDPFKYSEIERPFRIPPYRLCVIGNYHIAKRADLRRVADILGTRHTHVDHLLNYLCLEKEDQFSPLNIKNFYENLDNFGERLVKDIVAPIFEEGFLLEGFPYTASHLEQMISLGYYPEQIFYLRVENKTLMKDQLKFYIKEYKEMLLKKLEVLKLQNEDWMSQRKLRFEEQIAQFSADIVVEEGKEEGDRVNNRLEPDILAAILRSFNVKPAENYQEQKRQLYVADLVNEEMPPDKYTKLIDEVMTFKINEEINSFIQRRIKEYVQIKSVAEKHLIPFIQIRLHPHTTKEIEKTVLKYIKESADRQYIFDRAYRINLKNAMDYLELGQFMVSRYFWNCPVRNLEMNYPMKLILQTPDLDQKLQPFIHHEHIYFVQRVHHNVEQFFARPYLYTTSMNVYKTTKPIGLVVHAPRNGGCQALCDRITEEFQLNHFLMDDMKKYVITKFRWTKLAKRLLDNSMQLTNNQEICDLIKISINFEYFGWVIRDLPLNADLIECFILNSLNITLVVYLDPSGSDMWNYFKHFYNKDKYKRKLDVIEKLYSIVANLEKFANHHTDFKGLHQNVITVKGFTSRWSAWHKVNREILLMLRLLNLYDVRTNELAAASINKLDVTDYELKFRLSHLKLYCPLCWLQLKLLTQYEYPYSDDAEAKSLYSDNSYEKNLFQFRKHFYWSCNTHLVELMVNCDTYLPTHETIPEELPKLVKDWKNYVITNQGYCPVAYLTSSETSVIIGLAEFSVLYFQKIYVMSNESHCIKFLQNPELYKDVLIAFRYSQWSDLNEDLINQELDFGTITPTLITNGLLECALDRPKHYGLDPGQSLEIFLGLFFKCHNSNSSDAVIEVQKNLFLKYWDECKLVQRSINEMQITGNPYLLRVKKTRFNTGVSTSSAFGF